MNTDELASLLNDLNESLDFEELVDKTKDICNNFAVKSHCQSTFIIDKDRDFLAEIFSKEESFFVAINRRYNKNIIVLYTITK